MGPSKLSFDDSRRDIGHLNGKLMMVAAQKSRTKHKKLSTALRALFSRFPFPVFSCKGIALAHAPSEHPVLGSCVIGTLYGHRKGHVYLAVQDDPKCFPIFILELATPTSALVKEMASGLVRIALECERSSSHGKPLLQERTWTMFCNGRKTGYAVHRDCSEIDRRILTLVQAVSMGAGVLPLEEEAFDGEMMYMRARFERVIGSRDSEAFYMMNPDGNGGPELSIFLLRV